MTTTEPKNGTPMTYTELRERILTAIPGYDEAVRRDTNARKQLENPDIALTFGSAYADVKDKITALLDAGEPVPADIAEGAAQAELYDRALNLRKQIMTEFRPTKNSFQAGFIALNADIALAALREELTALVDRVKAIADDLHGITSADEAIEMGAEATDAWRELRTLRDHYDHIRTLQFDLYRDNVSDAQADTVAKVGLVTESIDVVPFFVSRRLKHANESFQTSDASVAYAQWLREANAAWNVETESHWWPTSNREEHLLHICTQLTPWVPSSDDLDTALRTALTATLAVDTDKPTHLEAARAQYYSTVASGPATTLGAPSFELDPRKATSKGGTRKARADYNTIAAKL